MLIVMKSDEWSMMLFVLLISSAIASITAFCPEFLKDEKTCSCFAYLDGAVIKCRGPAATKIIEKLKSAPSTEIRELGIEDASIIEIGPRAFRNLRIKRLVLDNNKIRTIHIDAFRGLENTLVSLSIAHNKLTEIPTDSLTGLNVLQILNLQCNNIGNIYTPVFRNVSRLIELNLACNQICKISGSAFDSIKDSLQSLILDQNCFKEIPAEALRNFKQLIALHMQYNDLTTIDKLQLMNMLSLLMIRLTGNRIRSVDRYGFNNVPNLRYLFLDKNEMTAIEPNTLQQFKFLEIIDLSYNKIAEITAGAFRGLDHLLQLNLEGNLIKDISPASFAGTPLLLLLLGHNCLSAVNQQMFQGVPFLSQLSLTNNNLRVIQPFSFGGLPSLQTLDLSRNKLQNLAPSTITPNAQTTVLVQENPLVCAQGGYHIIQGSQPILLLNELNVVCKSKNVTIFDDSCPTRKEVPQAPPCCVAPKIATTSAAPQPEETPSGLITGAPNTIIPFNFPDLKEKITEILPIEDASEVTLVPPVHQQQETYSSTEEPTTTISVTTPKAPNEKNLERFWRFTAPPRPKQQQVTQRTQQPLPKKITLPQNNVNIEIIPKKSDKNQIVVAAQEESDGEQIENAHVQQAKPQTETEQQPEEPEQQQEQEQVQRQIQQQLQHQNQQESNVATDVPPWMRTDNKNKFGFPRQIPHINGQAGPVGPRSSFGENFGLPQQQQQQNFQPFQGQQQSFNNNFQQVEFRQTPLRPAPSFAQFQQGQQQQQFFGAPPASNFGPPGQQGFPNQQQMFQQTQQPFTMQQQFQQFTQPPQQFQQQQLQQTQQPFTPPQFQQFTQPPQQFQQQPFSPQQFQQQFTQPPQQQVVQPQPQVQSFQPPPFPPQPFQQQQQQNVMPLVQPFPGPVQAQPQMRPNTRL